MSFNSLGPRRFGAESLDLDFAKDSPISSARLAIVVA
jgi:hypothetical protein